MLSLDTYLIHTYLDILLHWPWASISETIHRMLGHTTEVLILNGCRGLKRMAEQGNESLHRVQRRTREQGARKVSLVKGDEDTFRYTIVEMNGIVLLLLLKCQVWTLSV